MPPEDYTTCQDCESLIWSEDSFYDEDTDKVFCDEGCCENYQENQKIRGTEIGRNS